MRRKKDVLSVGTTARPRPERPLLTPRDTVQRLVTSRGEVAVVFGDERGGMTAEEVDAVDLLASIPSAPEQPSWNLAQAVAIFAYELRVAALAGEPRNPGPRASADPGALAAVDRHSCGPSAGAERAGASMHSKARGRGHARRSKDLLALRDRR